MFNYQQSVGDGWPRPKFKPAYSVSRDRDEKIKAAQERKAALISSAQDRKEQGILVSSVYRDAGAWVYNHPDWNKEMADEDREAWLANIEMIITKHYAGNHDKIWETYLLERDKLIDAVLEEEVVIGNEGNEDIKPEDVVQLGI